MKSVMQHNFAQVPAAEIPRSSFDRSCGYKTTFDSGYLVPVFLDEALPGDTFNLTQSFFTRLATPIVPFMDNLYLDWFYFAVPYRLVWDNWAKMNGEQTDPGDSTDYQVPVMSMPAVTGATIGSLSDYFGIPTGVPNLVVTSLFHRGYNLIYNEWYRDQNLQDSVVVDRDDGPDTYTDYVLLRRGKRHDYFTSALPWPQKGDSITLPLGTVAPVVSNGINPEWTNGTDTLGLNTVAASAWAAWSGVAAATGGMKFTDTTGLEADLSDATAATINQLRQAFQIQKLLERDARGGTRLTEIIRAHFGVVSPDARMQRPEYLGGGSMKINIHPVAQTSETNDTPQGNLAAMGVGSSSGSGFTKSFTEHCLIFGLVCVRADLNYQQGLNRMFSRRTRYEFYWPALSHIGEQAILNKEIYATASSTDSDPFGYQERYAEYRYKPSVITGKFRSTAAQSLDVWHLAQEFESLPVLNSTFIVENPPVDRVIATPDEPQFMFDAYFKYKCARPMPVYGVPGLIDHF